MPRPTSVVAATLGLGTLVAALTNTVQVRRMRANAIGFADVAHDLRVVSGQLSDDLPLRVEILGDSAARGYAILEAGETLTHRLADELAARREVAAGGVSVVCHAADGARTAEVVAEQVPLLAADADLVVVCVGVNDALKLTGRRALARATTDAVAAVRRQAPQAGLVYAVCPDLHRAPGFPWPFSELIRLRCTATARTQRAALRDHLEGADPRVAMVDFGAPSPEHFGLDGFHPGPLGQRAMARLLAEGVPTGWLRPRPSGRTTRAL